MTASAEAKPNFLIVGAAKSGTTSLYHYLRRRPDVFMSDKRKEGRHFSGVGEGGVYWPAYYSFETAPTWRDYLDLFERHAGEPRIGDASPDYLAYAHIAAPRILDRLGADTRIIAILRDPVSRAWSHYLQNVRREAEFFSFETTLDLEPRRAAAQWGFQWLYTINGRYADQLPHYIERFEPLVLLQEDLDADPAGTLDRIADYLDLPRTDAPPPKERFNTGGVPAGFEPILSGVHDDRAGTPFEQLHRELSEGSGPKGPSADGVYPPVDTKTLIYPELPEAARVRVYEALRPSVERLQDMIDRDLSHWSGR